MKRFLQIILIIISINAKADDVIIPYGKNNITVPLLKYKSEGTIPDASTDGSWVTGAGCSNHFFMNNVFKIDPTVYTGNFHLYNKTVYVLPAIQLSKGTYVLLPPYSKGQMISNK